MTGLQEGQLVALANPELEHQNTQSQGQRDEGSAAMKRHRPHLLGCGQAFDNLRAQKTRTLLTALGIVFGVGSVIGMLAIGAGAREESLRFIEQLGVRNVLVDSRRPPASEELQQRRRDRRRASPIATCASCAANIDALEDALAAHDAASRPRAAQARRTTCPSFTACARPTPSIHSLHLAEGQFFDEQDDAASARRLRARRSAPK